jgi:iron-sulfur cluster assembly protein
LAWPEPNGQRKARDGKAARTFPLHKGLPTLYDLKSKREFQTGDRERAKAQFSVKLVLLIRESDMASNMATAGKSFAIISLTEAAAARAHELIGGSSQPIAALRVGVKNGGCAGMSYTMDFAETIQPFDEVVEDKGVKIVIDPKALMFLFGTEMDFQADKLGAGFVFNNPNQTGSCGCGESVSITPRKEMAV